MLRQRYCGTSRGFANESCYEERYRKRTRRRRQTSSTTCSVCAESGFLPNLPQCTALRPARATSARVKAHVASHTLPTMLTFRMEFHSKFSVSSLHVPCMPSSFPSTTPVRSPNLLLDKSKWVRRHCGDSRPARNRCMPRLSSFVRERVRWVSRRRSSVFALRCSVPGLTASMCATAALASTDTWFSEKSRLVTLRLSNAARTMRATPPSVSLLLRKSTVSTSGNTARPRESISVRLLPMPKWLRSTDRVAFRRMINGSGGKRWR